MIESLNGVTVVTIAGKHYKTSAIAATLNQLSALERASLVLDVSGLETDSNGVREILEFELELQKAGSRHFWVIPSGSRIETILKHVGFIGLLPHGHCESLAEALGRFAKPPQ